MGKKKSNGVSNAVNGKLTIESRENGEQKKEIGEGNPKKRKRRAKKRNASKGETKVDEGIPQKKMKVESISDGNMMEVESISDKKKKRKRKNSENDTVEDSPGKKMKVDLDSNSESTSGKKKKKKRKNKSKGKNTQNGELTVNTVEDKDDEKMDQTNDEDELENASNQEELENASNQEELENASNQEELDETKKKNNKIDKSSNLTVTAKLNNEYSDQSQKDNIKNCWNKDSSFNGDDGLEVLNKPFKCCYMPKFLQDKSFLQKVKEELETLKYNEKNNDLYKFTQSKDLKYVSSPHLFNLRKFLYGDFRRWLCDVTGIELNKTVDMGSSKYEYTDGLLCHDDELEGRRIAYILYLTPPWYEKDGGSLDLFDVDGNGEPRNVVQSLLPKWNTFAFFEVSPVSFHQVREVLSKDKLRLSINGWFHGPSIDRPPKHVEVPRELLSPVDLEEDQLYAWINPSYLDADTQKQIRKKFQNDSEIELENFLCDVKYDELSKALLNVKLKWENTGPANKQSYKVLKDVKLPHIVKDCRKFLRSEALFLILSQLTGLKLHKLAPPDSDPDSDEEEEEENKDSNPGMTMDIRQWGPGSYTLLRDSDHGEKKSSLDCSLFLNVADTWTLDWGGYTSYIAEDEDEELLTVEPRSNCFALVYRDAETLKFTKYINNKAKDLGKTHENSFFFDINCVYKE